MKIQFNFLNFKLSSCTKALTTYAPSAGAFATPTSGFSRTSRNQKAMEANRWTFGALNILQSQHTFLRTPSSQLVSNHVSNPCKDQIHTWESIIFFNYATGIIFRQERKTNNINSSQCYSCGCCHQNIKFPQFNKCKTNLVCEPISHMPRDKSCKMWY